MSSDLVAQAAWASPQSFQHEGGDREAAAESKSGKERGEGEEREMRERVRRERRTKRDTEMEREGGRKQTSRKSPPAPTGTWKKTADVSVTPM